MDTSDDILDIGLDLTLPDIPEPTPEEMQAIAHLLPSNFGKHVATIEPKEPSPLSVTRYSEKISMRIPRPVLALLKEEAKRRGVPYQTFLNMILGQHAMGGGWA